MRNYISELVLKKEEYEGAYHCRECREYLIPEDSAEELSKKEAAIERLLAQTAKQPVQTSFYWEEALDAHPEVWIYPDENGSFPDLEDTDAGITTAFQRLGRLSDRHHWKAGMGWQDPAEKEKFLKAVKNYCEKELAREDQKNSRFHHSIFAIPTAAVNICFSLYPELLKAQEEPEKCSPEMLELFRLLFEVAMQCFRLPLRGDHTDRHPVCLERFRGHVWWVGGNGIRYRPVFFTAILFRSVPMMNVVATVAQNALTATSGSWNEKSFWTEGICADGLGWGHGRQNYATGYPIHGTEMALRILTILRDTVWGTRLELTWGMRFLEGIQFMEYKGWIVPVLGRVCFEKDWKNKAETFNGFIREMKKYLKDLGGQVPEEEPLGNRYFWNNDCLVRKTDKEYLLFNMASNRCDGVECAHEMADKRNFFLTDGACFACKDPAEYERAIGCFRASGIPGVTARFLENKEIMPETNWHGYHSQFDFAGGIAGENYGAAGFVFLKDLTRMPDGSGKVYEEFSPEIAGIYAHKSCFFLGDTTVCLGAGITDKEPSLGKEICTEVNLVERLSESYLVREETGKEKLTAAETRISLQDAGSLCIWQNGSFYGFPEGQNTGSLCIYFGKRKTAWEELNANNNPEDNEELPILELFLDHGKAVENGSYCYYIYTGQEKAEEYLQAPQFKVLENSTVVQAVESSDGSLVEGVYYGIGESRTLWGGQADRAAGQSEEGYLLKTKDYEICLETPVVFALQKADGENKVQITLADPLQRDGGKYRMKIRKQKDQTWKLLIGEFPKELLCGSQILTELQL